MAGVAIAVTLVHREFFAPPSPRPATRRASAFVNEWKNIAEAGRIIGDSNSRVKIVEFMDLECPFCRDLNRARKTVMGKFPGQVAYVFVHYPLSNHRFARRAAQAAECASQTGKFASMVDALYTRQEAFGLRPWSAYAADAGVRDLSGFERCMQDTTPSEAIAAGLAAGRQIGLDGTPTVLLNGWRYGSTPADTEITRAIEDILAGRSPYPGFHGGGY